MQRRRFLAGLSALVTGAAAGCASESEVPLTAPEPPAGVAGAETDDGPTPTETDRPPAVTIETFDTAADDEGNFVVVVTVANETDRALTAYAAVTVTLADGPQERGRFAALGPTETATVRVPFPFSRERFLDEGSLDLFVEERDPETPLPTATAAPTETAVRATAAADSTAATADTASSSDADG